MTAAQVWKSTKFTIERRHGRAPGTVIFRLSGPFTARDMHGTLSPVALRNTFESEPETGNDTVHIIDLTEVPYMDSAGLGMIVSHYVRCQNKGIRLVAAGVCPRILQLLEMTKTENLFAKVDTVEEADRS
jgi:anti-anti-sigma factor